MNEDFPNQELQALWNDQPENLTIINMKELTMSLQQDHRKEQKQLLFLNLQEIIPAAGVFLWLGWQGLQAETRQWAWFAAALTALGVAVFLISSSLRQRRLEQAFDNSMKGELERSLSQVQHRSNLYRTVAWWYLVPSVLGVILTLIASGVDFGAPATLVILAVAAAGAVGLYLLNRKIGRDKYEPKVEHFTNLLAQLGAN